MPSSLVPIESITLSDSTTTMVAFENISDEYETLKIIWQASGAWSGTGSNWMFMRVGKGSTPSTGNYYMSQYMRATGTGTPAGSVRAGVDGAFLALSNFSGAGNNTMSPGVIDIYNWYALGNVLGGQTKLFNGRSMSYSTMDMAATDGRLTWQGMRNGLSDAWNSLFIYMEVSNTNYPFIKHSTFDLYGLKRS